MAPDLQLSDLRYIRARVGKLASMHIRTESIRDLSLPELRVPLFRVRAVPFQLDASALR